MSTDYNATAWTASDLQSDVWRACRLPEGGTTDYPSSVILREAMEAIWNFAGHSVARAREGRLVTTLLRAVTSSSIVTTGQDYELPPMAVGDTIETVTWIDSSGNRRQQLYNIPLAMEAHDTSPNVLGTPQYFSLLGDVLRILPRPAAAGSLRIDYQRRHGQLVLAAETASVTAVVPNGASARVTLASTPTGFGLGAWLDFIGSSYPYRTKIHGASITTAHGSNQFTLSTPYTDFDRAQLIGDTATLYGKTPYVQLPLELKPAVTKMIAAKILDDLGDTVLAGRREAAAERDAERARAMLSPRAERQKAFNPNSLARSLGMRWGLPRWNRRDG